MSSKYKELERAKQVNLLKKDNIFINVKANGVFMGKERDFVLVNGNDNLYPPIVADALKYFRENKIAWWKGRQPTGHLLSSQISCINHLFALRFDKDIVLGLLNYITDNQFMEVLPTITDKDGGYISFEAVSDNDYLNELSSSRGTQCTSIDALIYAIHNNGERWIVPIEWKYTEFYGNGNKALGTKGIVRQRRYNELIKNSTQLKDEQIGLFYYEPFYQLMRQTLWAEQMIFNSHTERIQAQDYIHLHIIPTENSNLLNKKYKLSNSGMEDSWRNSINNQGKYKIIDNKKIIEYISLQASYAELGKYLFERYG